MASYASDYTLNLAANELANRTIQVRLHSGAPGNAGTANRIGTVAQDVAPGGWTDASGGVAETVADTNFGVLDANAQVTPVAYSLWDGANFVAWGDVFQPGTSTVGQPVPAGRTFSLTAGTVELRAQRPAA